MLAASPSWSNAGPDTGVVSAAIVQVVCSLSTTIPNHLLTAIYADGMWCGWSVATSSFPETTSMAKTVESRLVKLEQRLPVGGATCRTWMDAVLVDDDGSRARSEDCPACGRFVPIRTVIVIRGVPWRAV